MISGRDAALVVVASLVLASLGSPLVGTVAAAQDEAAIYDAPGGTQISTATDGETVYINATAGTRNGTTELVTVTNGTASVTITMYDTGNGPDPTGSDGEYWGSFNLSATTTDDATDTLLVQKGNSASATVDLDNDGNSASVSVTADYGPVPRSAATVDADRNGTVDNVTVTFDEPVSGSVSYATSDFTVSGATVTAIASNDGDDTLRLEVDSAPTNDTSITPDVTVTQDAVQDTNGNAGPASGDVTVTAADGAAPVALNATYRDASADGTVDRIDVAYSEDVSGSSYTDSDWTLTTAGSVNLSKDGTGTVSGAEVRIDVTGDADTTGGATAPTLDYAGTSVTDGPNAAPSQTLTVGDGAAPTFAGATTADASANGYVDNLTVTFTEAIASGSVEAADLSIGSANGLSGSVSGVSGDDGDATVNVTVAEGSTTDTGATPTLAYAQAGGSSTAIQDATGNLMSDTTSAAATDGAAPYATALTALDGAAGGTDGAVDRIRIDYSEDVSSGTPEVGDYTLGDTDAGRVSLDSAGTDGSAIVVDVTGPVDDTALNLTLSYDRTAGTGGSVTDGATNPAASFSGRTVADGAGPLLQSVTTTDGDVDGTVENLTVTYTESVDDSTVSVGDFSLSTGSADSIVTPQSADDNETTLAVTGFPTDTSVTPDVTLSGDSITDLAATPNGNPPRTLTATDGAAPVVTAATTKDANGDGTVDRIDVTLSEPLDDGASTLDASAFSLSTGSVDGVSTGGSADDDTVRLTVSGLSGSDATPDVTYASNTFVDSLGNGILTTTFTGTTSGVAPVVESATVLDRDGDGNVDAATLTFSGSIDDSTVTPGNWALGGTATDAVDTLSTADDDRLQVQITTDADEVSGTDAVDVTYTPGSTTSLAGNAVAGVAAGDVTESDGAAPVVTGLSATTNEGRPRVQVQVTASEPLDAVEVDLSGPASRTLSTFSLSGSGPYVHTLSYRAEVSGQYTATLQRAVDAAGNGAAVGQQDSARVDLPDGGGSPVPQAPGSPADRVSSSTALVFSDTESITFDFGTGRIDRVAVTSSATGNGFARSTTLTSPPQGVAAPGDPAVGFVSIQLPDDWRSTPATLRLTVDTSGTSADAADLRIARYDETTDSWQTFETTVESRQGSTAVLVAETPGFSTFAVVESPETASTTVEVTTATPTPTPTDSGGDGADTTTVTATSTDGGAGTPADTPTSSPAATTAGNGPGFGALAGLAALAALTALVARRRRE